MNYLKATVVLFLAFMVNINVNGQEAILTNLARSTESTIKTKKIEKNSIAVLPSYFILEEDFNKSYALRVQSFILDFLRRKDRKFKLNPINKREVNAAIYSSKLSSDDIHNMPIGDLCDVMGTEYIMITEVTKVLEGVEEDTAFGAAVDENGLAGSSQKRQKRKFVTNTNLWVYNRSGELVYENSIRPFSIRASLHFENEDWKAHVRTLIKKMPQYK